MEQKKTEKKNLREVEREYQNNADKAEYKNSEGRNPDQQHHMKDQENLRK